MAEKKKCWESLNCQFGNSVFAVLRFGFFVPDVGFFVPDVGFFVPDVGFFVPDVGTFPFLRVSEHVFQGYAASMDRHLAISPQKDEVSLASSYRYVLKGSFSSMNSNDYH